MDRKWVRPAATLIAGGILFLVVGWALVLHSLITHQSVSPPALLVLSGAAAVYLGFLWLRAMGLRVSHVKLFGRTYWRR